jgi:hypothetical protein
MNTVLAALALALVARQAGAQQIRGVVRDSVSRIPIPGAVVSALDSAGQPRARSITDERGAYVLVAGADAHRLRIVRLGFRPVDVDLPAGRSGEVSADILMRSIPFQLQPIRVTADNSCPKRGDRADALALLEQARAGLLATVVARSARPAQMKRLRIKRRMLGNSPIAARQQVRVETVPSTVAAFGAATSATNFVRQGFAAGGDSSATFFAPDADVLLDDEFAAGYCFRIMDRNKARPHQVGLGFRAADSRPGRVDVDGALWIDTVARSLVDIEFAYVGLEPDLYAYEPGGHVEFRTMTNGVVLIDRWFLRLVGDEPDTVNARTSHPVVAEVGGELAHVTWDDGSVWDAALGTVRLTVRSKRGALLVGVTVRLDDTDYRATTDASGVVEFRDLAPGPYVAELEDHRLESLGVRAGTSLKLVAARGTVKVLKFTTPTAEDFVIDRCGKGPVEIRQPAWLVGRVMTADHQPVTGVTWSLTIAHNGDETAAVPIAQTRDDGVFAYCGAMIPSRALLTFERNGEIVSVNQLLNDSLTVLPVRMSRR